MQLIIYTFRAVPIHILDINAIILRDARDYGHICMGSLVDNVFQGGDCFLKTDPLNQNESTPGHV